MIMQILRWFPGWLPLDMILSLQWWDDDVMWHVISGLSIGIFEVLMLCFALWMILSGLLLVNTAALKSDDAPSMIDIQHQIGVTFGLNRKAIFYMTWHCCNMILIILVN